MDRGDVIKGLRCCTKLDGDGYPNCERCPYSEQIKEGIYDCADVRVLMRDALEMLKAQEPTAAEEPAKRCGGCKWLRDPEFTCVCVNGDSPNVADFMDRDDSCECWEAQKEEAGK